MLFGGVNDKLLDELINVDKDRLYRIAYIHVKNEEDALDIVQETIYKAYFNIKKLKEPQYFKTWITRILVNTSLNHIKKFKKLDFLEEVELEKQGTSEENYMELYDAVDRLEDKYKTIIVLKYFEDMKIKEISEVLDMSESNVKNYLYRGLEKLRIQLGEDDIDE